MWWAKPFLLLLPLLVVFFVFASDQKLEVVPEPENGGGGEKVLVEVTDAMEEEEEEPVLAFKPSVAPATPQVLPTLSPRYIVHEVPSVAESSVTDSSINAELYNDSLIMINPSQNVTNNQVPDASSAIVIIPSLSLPDQQMSATVALPDLKKPFTSTVKPSDVPDEKSVVSEATTIENPTFAVDDNVNVVPLDSVGTVGAPSVETEKEKDLKEKDPKGLNSSKTETLVETGGLGREEKPASSEEAVTPQEGENMDRLDEKTEGEKDVEVKRVDIEYKATIEEKTSKVINVTDSPSLKDKIVPSKLVEEDLGVKSTKLDTVEVDVKPPKQVDEDGEIKENEKMISFAKWKKEKEDVITVNQTTTTIPQNKPKTKTRNKIKKNFASIDCGGKVIAANSEAQNILSVLKEDKDIYMLNPCNVKAWFIVELCDRIQVDSIDLANFEMFSSTPEVFNVYVTSRYPSGNWEKVDTFQAKNVKAVQTFGFKEVFYAKYIKLEVKKYFGSEHYCPLSLLRVFGITEVEQFEDHDENEQGNEIEVIDEHHVELNPGDDRTDDENSANIFQAAKNVVAGLVNGMASKLSGKSDLEGSDSNNSTNSAVVTVTAISEENELIEAGDNSTRYYKDSLIVGERHVDWEMWYYYRYPKHTCPLIDPKRFIKELKATVFLNNNDPLPTLVSSIVNDNLIAKIVPTPYATPLPKTVIEMENISIPVTQGILATSTVAEKEVIQTERNTALHTSPTPSVSSSVVVSEVISVTPSTLPIEANVTSEVKYTVEKAIDDSDTADELHFNVNETVNGAVVAEKIVKNVSNSNVAPVQNVSTGSPSLELPVNDENENSDITNPVDSLPLDISHTSTSSQDQANTTESSSIVQGYPEDDKSSNHHGTHVDLPPAIPPPVQLPDLSAKDTKQEKTVVVNANSETKSQDKKTESPTEYLKIEKEILALTAKPTSGSKESIIGKLNAKVKGLEANLTMSMMYLDEMSERYQLHVEKVDERHKKKYSALNASFQHQQELIYNQSIRIDNLTKQLSDVVFQLHNLTITTQDQHQKMIETHATWVFLEIIFISVFLLLCRRTKKGGGGLNTNGEEDDAPSVRRHSEPMLSNSGRSNLQRTASDLSDSALSSAIKNGGPLQQNALMGKKRSKRKKNSRSEVDLVGAAVHSDCAPVPSGWMNGITEVFKRTNSNEKISRQADALIDEVPEYNSNNLLRKVRSSSELPVIHEDYADGLQYMEYARRFNDAEFFRKCS